ncbi:hypothetical protein BASA81_008956, partial [Batrachochytrium salamandrivorans]
MTITRQPQTEGKIEPVVIQQLPIDASFPSIDNDVETAAMDPTEPSLASLLWEITTAYVPLTYTSFGGPQVHIAMFIHEFVEKRKWLPSHVFAELFAIAQALPGPAS